MITEERKNQIAVLAREAAYKKYPMSAILTTFPTAEDHARVDYAAGYFQALVDAEEGKK